jgi:hypothetical protein
MKKLVATIFCASIIYLIHKFYIHFICSSSTFVKLFIQKGNYEIATFSSKLTFYRPDIIFPSTSLHVPKQGKIGYFTLGEWSHKKGKWIFLNYPHRGQNPGQSGAFCPRAKHCMFLVSRLAPTSTKFQR